MSKILRGIAKFLTGYDTYGFPKHKDDNGKIIKKRSKSFTAESVSIALKMIAVAIIFVACSHVDAIYITAKAVTNPDDEEISAISSLMEEYPELTYETTIDDYVTFVPRTHSSVHYVSTATEEVVDTYDVTITTAEEVTTTTTSEESEPDVTTTEYVTVEPINDYLAPTFSNDDLMNMGVNVGNHKLTQYALPNAYYGNNIDFTTMQPFMDYRYVTAVGTGSYSICHSVNAYTDSYGLRRYKTTADQLTVNGADDYVIALGTYYKPYGVVGTRYLIITSTGAYTAITGDEKADDHTDPYHMYGYCGVYGEYAGLIEWVVDERYLEPSVAVGGTITASSIEKFQGEILAIYLID